MRRIALIPARGGSKRLPRKNIVDFQGRPIIAWTIAAARDSALFSDIVVSTDDEEIAAVADTAGARVVMRPEHLATDSATVVDTCLDFLDAEEKSGRVYDLLCCLYATSPLRGADDIQTVVSYINPGINDFSLAATHYTLPPHQALRLRNDFQAEPVWPDLIRKRAADIGQLVVDNGSTYAVSVAAFKALRSFYGPDLCVHVMDRERSCDIDTADDLNLALYYAQLIRGRA